MSAYRDKIIAEGAKYAPLDWSKMPMYGDTTKDVCLSPAQGVVTNAWVWAEPSW